MPAVTPAPVTPAAVSPAAVVTEAGAPPDHELTRDLALVRGGDEDAFRRVYRAVQPGLLRYLSVLVGAEAEDIASETWAQACRDLARFRGDIDDFRAWIVTIGRHRGLDHHRARRRRPVDLLDSLPDAPAADCTEDSVLDGLSTAAALDLIGRLPRDQAEAVLLRAVVGLDAASAGRVLGKRAGAVRTSAHRGLRTLAALLAGAAAGNTSGPRDADGAR